MKRFSLLKIAICVIAVVLVTMFNSGCEKENGDELLQITNIKTARVVSDEDVMKNLPKVKDGRLVFKDSTNFNMYIYWLSKNQDNPEKILKVNEQLGFTCMFEIYERGIDYLIKNEVEASNFIKTYPNVFFPIEIDGSIMQDMLTPSLFGYFLNENGIFQIENKIIKFDYNYSYVIIDGNEQKIPILISAKDGNVADDSIIVHLDVPHTRNQYSYRTEYFDSKHRVVSRLKWRRWSDGSNSHEEYEAVTNAQKKAGAWIATNDFDYVSLKIHAGYYSLNNGTGPLYTNENTFTSTKHKVSRTYLEPAANLFIDELRSLIPITHSAKYNGAVKTIYYSNAITAQF